MKKLIFLLFLSFFYLVYDILSGAGVFKTLVAHGQQNIVQTYDQAAGTEDMQVDHGRGLLFISSTDRWATKTGNPVEGGIYIMSLDTVDVPKLVPTTFVGKLFPHGISLFIENEDRYLFVINHNSDGNFVEQFEYKNDTLFHLKSVESPLMCCPNDVVATGVNQFYVTNDHGFSQGLFRTLEDYLKLPKSYILYYDGNVMSTVYTGLSYANGINVSNDGKTLYATHTTGQELMMFDIQFNGELNLKAKLNLETGVDNIDVAQNGDLWIGAHPKMLDFVAHAKASTNTSPSQVLKVSLEPSGQYKVEEMFLDNGKVISGSSVAVLYKEYYYVGVVFENKILKIRNN